MLSSRLILGENDSVVINITNESSPPADSAGTDKAGIMLDHIEAPQLLEPHTNRFCADTGDEQQASTISVKLNRIYFIPQFYFYKGVSQLIRTNDRQ